jgi:peptide/nickel transport system permease protein
VSARRFLARRLAHGALVVLCVSVFTFGLLALAPGDFFEELRLDSRVSPETLATLRAQYGLDRPLPVRYLRWLGAALHGDLGFSLAYNAPATPLLLARAGNTLLLAGCALVLTWLVALPLGVTRGGAPGGPRDRLVSLASAVLLAVPEVAIVLLLLLLALRTRRLPVGGMVSSVPPASGEWLRDRLAHLVLPVLALTLAALPSVLRHVRAAVAEVLDAPFVRAAEAHGIPRRRRLWRHVLPAGANPIVTLFGSSVGALLSGSLLVEVVMGWPGLGPLLLEAVLARDVHLVIGAVMLSAVSFMAGHLLADVLLWLADPRIRAETP